MLSKQPKESKQKSTIRSAVAAQTLFTNLNIEHLENGTTKATHTRSNNKNNIIISNNLHYAFREIVISNVDSTIVCIQSKR